MMYLEIAISIILVVVFIRPSLINLPTFPCGKSSWREPQMHF